MAKYIVSLGEISKEVVLEATTAQIAMENFVAMMESQSIALIPREDKRETYWFARNVAKPTEEFLLKNTEEARKFVAKVRKDCVDIFWFVSFDEHSNRKVSGLKPSRRMNLRKQIISSRKGF
jgi:hypothetical protein